MLTLGIETSCDETAVAVVENGKVLSSEVSSSVHLHAQYGGVVPEIASRYHTEYILPVYEKALDAAGIKQDDVDQIAVTSGPGLPGSLLVGISFAKAVSFALGKPIVGVDHLSAHLVSCFLDKAGKSGIEGFFPFTGAVISGGHTSIYDCRDLRDMRVIGRTKDDAAGEAFDKVAKILGLGYPGGPVIEEKARRFTGKSKIRFPRALLSDPDDLDFSFSGIKTAVLYYWKDRPGTEGDKEEICSAFQDAVVDVLVRKLLRGVARTGNPTLAVGGGVVNNSFLREKLRDACDKEKIELYIPSRHFCTDNAAMTALLGERLFLGGETSDLFLNASPARR